MATVSSEKLRKDVKAIIKNADLSTISLKKIRVQLQEKYDTDLTDRKKELEEIIYAAFKERQSQNNSEESGASNDEEPMQTKNGDSQSDSGTDFEEPEKDVPKKRNVKKQKKPQEVDDEELAQQLQQAENSTGRRTRNQSKPVRRKPAKPKSGGGDGTVKKRTGYGQPCSLSEKLAALMGSDEMARSDVIKKMWEIARERNLVDQKNKQFMICDDELFKIFGRKRVRMFGMMKYLVNHIFKKT